MADPKTQKRIFQVVSILFVLVMVYFTVDMLSRTTRPGRKGQLKDRIERRLGGDSVRTGDSTRSD
ncbi:MAG TPA: hypothetical protein VF646_03920 [Cytophagales bacterium]